MALNNALTWFSSNLSDRKQLIRCKGITSSLTSISIGVPQGTVLGSILFILYVNDLPFHLEPNSSIMYADDTSLKNHLVTQSMKSKINYNIEQMKLFLIK